MFDLNNSLHDWRERFREAGRFRPEDVDELEEHLHEEMAKLGRVGLSEEESYLLAARRLGGVDALGREFEKVNPFSVWQSRLRWMAVGAITVLGVMAAEAALQRLWIVAAGLLGFSEYPILVGLISPLLSLGALAALAVLAVQMVKHRKQHDLALCPSTTQGRFGFLLAVFLWFTLLPLGSALSQALLSNYVSPHTQGMLNLAVMPGRFAVSLLVPLVIMAWLVRTSRPASRLSTE
jgi:hypothetical protein